MLFFLLSLLFFLFLLLPVRSGSVCDSIGQCTFDTMDLCSLALWDEAKDRPIIPGMHLVCMKVVEDATSSDMTFDISYLKGLASPILQKSLHNPSYQELMKQLQRWTAGTKDTKEEDFPSIFSFSREEEENNAITFDLAPTFSCFSFDGYKKFQSIDDFVNYTKDPVNVLYDGFRYEHELERARGGGIENRPMVCTDSGLFFHPPSPSLNMSRMHNIPDPMVMPFTLKTVSFRPLVFEVEGLLVQSEVDHLMYRAMPLMQITEEAKLGHGGKQEQGKEEEEEEEDIDSPSNHPTHAHRTDDQFVQQESKASIPLAHKPTSQSPTSNDRILSDINKRIAAFSVAKEINQERIQVVRYGKGRQYHPHADFYHPLAVELSLQELKTKPSGAKDTTYGLTLQDIEKVRSNLAKGRKNRYASIVMYLNDVEEGGETNFPYAWQPSTPSSSLKQTSVEDIEPCSQGLTIPPYRSTSILFYSLLPNGKLDNRSVHCGCEVKNNQKIMEEDEEGKDIMNYKYNRRAERKWVANKWIWSHPSNYRA